MKIKLDEGAYMPFRAHEADAGYDIFAPHDCVVPAGGSVVIDSGVHVDIPTGYVGFLKSKSGLNIKSSITSEGVIDSGYTGSIRVKLYNNGALRYKVKKGDKISQLVILVIHTPELEIVDSTDDFAPSERGDNGFGSTGR